MIISAFYSGLRGGRLFADALIAFLEEKGLMDKASATWPSPPTPPSDWPRVLTASPHTPRVCRRCPLSLSPLIRTSLTSTRPSATPWRPLASPFKSSTASTCPSRSISSSCRSRSSSGFCGSKSPWRAPRRSSDHHTWQKILCGQGGRRRRRHHFTSRQSSTLEERLALDGARGSLACGMIGK